MTGPNDDMVEIFPPVDLSREMYERCFAAAEAINTAVNALLAELRPAHELCQQIEAMVADHPIREFDNFWDKFAGYKDIQAAALRVYRAHDQWEKIDPDWSAVEVGEVQS